jgi:hypothetical protein
MKNFDVNQIMRITGWTRPTAYSFMKRNDGRIIKNGKNPDKWVIAPEKILSLIKDEEKSVMAMKARYYAETRKQEENA